MSRVLRRVTLGGLIKLVFFIFIRLIKLVVYKIIGMHLAIAKSQEQNHRISLPGNWDLKVDYVTCHF